MAAFVTLLGEFIEKGDKTKVPVTSLGGEGKVLGLYFSAHWCPPCRKFTPTLAEFYKKFKQGGQGDLFEIVFISSDRDQDQFDTYFKEMPWLSLPFSERDKKSKLSRKFKVSGIPTLIFLDGATGKIITSDGRTAVISDPEGEKFPWRPEQFSNVIKGKFINSKGEEYTEEDLKGKVTGLYFSAHWCPPCRAFTPRFAEVYQKIKDAGKNFVVVFISSDRSEESFSEYLNTMPWLALPFSDERTSKLKRMFGIEGIPSLVIIDEAGSVITTNGRGVVSSDPEGLDFPWLPKSVEELTERSGSLINEETFVILFPDLNEGQESEDVKKAIDILLPVADPIFEEAKAKEDQPPVRFLVGGETEISDSLKDFLKIDEDKLPQLILLDIPDQSIYRHKDTSGEITTDMVRKMVEDFLNNKLQFETIVGL